MGKIIGDPKTIENIRNAPGTARDIHVNFDALMALPDEYIGVISKVEYDPNRLEDRFYSMGKTGPYLPKPEMLYEIGEAKGIHGLPVLLSEAILEDVDYARVTHPGDITAPPEFRRIKVGHRVVKASEVVTEDGTRRRSSDREVIYNVWERCEELWSKEESYTDGYGKAGQYPNKYDTPHKRIAHLSSEMKFAAAKADTKAHEKTIRELAGLPTGYAKADLTSGALAFAKVIKSPEAVKLDAMAYRQGIARGAVAPAIEATTELFGDEAAADAAETLEALPPPPESPPVFEIEEGPTTPWASALNIVKTYSELVQLTDDDRARVNSIIGGLADHGEAIFEDDKKWKMTIDWLIFLEDKTPKENRLDHGLTAG